MGKRFPGILMIAVLVTLGIIAFASEGMEYRPGGKQYMKNRSDSGHGSWNMRNLNEGSVSKMN
ncbi:MAG: hypothetical protein Q8M56_08385, partial [Desulfobacterales bacterium]|nr:hypothetical protein [Desulfobacterales bacterium]